MAYVWVPKSKTKDPQSNDASKQDPAPALLVHHLNKNLSLGSSSTSRVNTYKRNDKPKRQHKNIKFVYGKKATGIWFSVGLANRYHIPSSLKLKAVSLPDALRWGNKALLVLVNNELETSSSQNCATASATDEPRPRLKSPWTSIAENVLEDVISSFHNLKNESNCQDLDELNPGFVVRLGKILFHGNPSFHPHSYRKRGVSENALRKLPRNLYTTVPPSYVDNITAHVVPEIQFDTKVEKESYRVKLSDYEQPDATIICECKVTVDGERVELYKIELNQVRHLVVDVSCFGKDLDIRLMLRTKRTVNMVNDMEMQSIRDLISSAILDSSVKGWLRWPNGMSCHGQRYKVTGVWHTKCVTYKKSSMRLRMRDVDRFDYKSLTEDISREVVLKLSEISSILKEDNHEDRTLLEVLKNNFKVIWEHFLQCPEFLNYDPILS